MRAPLTSPKTLRLALPALLAALAALAGLVASSCTQETQNRLSRGIQNWTGTDGVLDVISDGKLMYRFIKIDKLTTASSTGVGSSGESRAYRFGYGILDKNFNLVPDDDEKKVYFEVSDYSTQYVFYENPDD
jgi:hypothetical protein